MKEAVKNPGQETEKVGALKERTATTWDWGRGWGEGDEKGKTNIGGKKHKRVCWRRGRKGMGKGAGQTSPTL